MHRGRGKLNRRNFLLGLAGLGLMSWKLPDAHAYLPFEPFTFAYVTDVHLANDVADSFVLTHESQLFLQELVKELNGTKLDFVMFGGDQVQSVGKDEVNWQLFTDILQGLNAPWSFVLGERDISGDIPIDKMRTFGADWKQRGIETDTPFWSHNPASFPNIHLVGLDTSMPNTTVGGMSQRQLNWLKEDLEANKKYLTLVFAHHPLLPPPPYDGGPPWDDYTIPDSGSAREIIGAYPNVKLVVSGHLHIAKVQNERDVWHVSSPSLTVFPCAYRIFTVTPTAVTMETRQIEFPALVKKARKALVESVMADRFSRSDPNSFVELAEGTREDQDAILPLVGGAKAPQPYNPKKIKREKPAPPSKKPAEVQQPVEAQPRQKRQAQPRHDRGRGRRQTEQPAPEKPQVDVKTETKPDQSTPPGEQTPPKTEDINEQLDKALKGELGGNGKQQSEDSGANKQ